MSGSPPAPSAAARRVASSSRSAMILSVWASRRSVRASWATSRLSSRWISPWNCVAQLRTHVLLRLGDRRGGRGGVVGRELAAGRVHGEGHRHVFAHEVLERDLPAPVARLGQRGGRREVAIGAVVGRDDVHGLAGRGVREMDRRGLPRRGGLAVLEDAEADDRAAGPRRAVRRSARRPRSSAQPPARAGAARASSSAIAARVAASRRIIVGSSRQGDEAAARPDRHQLHRAVAIGSRGSGAVPPAAPTGRG